MYTLTAGLETRTYGSSPPLALNYAETRVLTPLARKEKEMDEERKGGTE